VSDRLLVLCAAGDEASGRRIATYLVEQRLAACVSLVPGARSFYRWKGRVEEADEVLLVIKTRAERLEALVQAVTSMHSYDVPEVVAAPIVGGFDRYLEWLDESVEG